MEIDGPILKKNLIMKSANYWKIILCCAGLILFNSETQSQNDAMQFTYSIQAEENDTVKQALYKIVVNKNGGLYYKCSLENIDMDMSMLVDNVHDRFSKHIIFVEIEGRRAYVKSTLDSNEICAMNAILQDDSELIRIEKLGSENFTFVKSDGSSFDYYPSRQYSDYYMLVGGILKYKQAVPIPDSIVFRSDRFNGKIYLDHASKANWQDAKDEIQKQMKNSKRMPNDKLCEYMALGFMF